MVTGREPSADGVASSSAGSSVEPADCPQASELGMTPLKRIIAVIRNSRSDSEAHIRFEGARVIVNLVKACVDDRSEHAAEYLMSNTAVAAYMSTR